MSHNALSTNRLQDIIIHCCSDLFLHILYNSKSKLVELRTDLCWYNCLRSLLNLFHILLTHTNTLKAFSVAYIQIFSVEFLSKIIFLLSACLPVVCLGFRVVKSVGRQVESVSVCDLNPWNGTVCANLNLFLSRRGRTLAKTFPLSISRIPAARGTSASLYF